VGRPLSTVSFSLRVLLRSRFALCVSSARLLVFLSVVIVPSSARFLFFETSEAEGFEALMGTAHSICISSVITSRTENFYFEL
jgi:hypothetical protein